MPALRLREPTRLCGMRVDPANAAERRDTGAGTAYFCLTPFAIYCTLAGFASLAYLTLT